MRTGASLLMYVALYQLAASIWTKSRPRRVFFLLVSVGSGFGWILAPLTGDGSFFDVTTPGAFPFYSSLMNVHYPLAIACVALLASVIVVIFRPGVTELPTVNNEGLTIFLVSLLLAFIYPLALIPLAIAFGINLAVDFYKTRTMNRPQLIWFLWFGVPALPMVTYYAAVAQNNRVVAEIWSQQQSSPVSPVLLILGLGLPLIVALPGISRAIRRFEADGDRFMLIWLLTIVALMYLPSLFQQRFTFALMIPIVYFATRATEDFWLRQVKSRRWHRRIFAAVLPIIAASHLFVLILPLRPLSTDDFSDAGSVLLRHNYVDAFNWLERNTDSSDVILASPDVSLWIPARVGARAVYAHPRHTTDPKIKKAAVLEWYRQTDAEGCDSLLRGDISFDGRYRVRYVIVGPNEEEIGHSVCPEALHLVRTFNTVKVYAVESIADIND